MDLISHSFSAKRIFLLSTIATFTLTSVTLPVQATHYEGVSASLADLAVIGIRVKKLIDKMNKYKDEMNSDKLINNMLDIKEQAELAIGHTISIDGLLDNLQNDLKAKGQKISKDEMKALKKMFKKKQDKRNHKVQFMAESIELGITYDEDLEIQCFEAKHKDDEAPPTVSLKMAIGVTCCLSGGFLVLIPIPMCKEVGTGVLMFGFSLVYDELVFSAQNEKKQLVF